MRSFIKEHKWIVMVSIILFLQAGVSVAAITEVAILNMLPLKFFIGVIALFVVMFGLIAGFLIPFGKKKGFRIFRRSFGSFLSVVTIVAAVMVTVYVGHLNHTVKAISTEQEVSNKIGVYVLKDSDTSNLKKSEDISFAITDSYDFENTSVALENMEEEAGNKIATENYKSVTDMVDALFRKDIDAVVLNEAYVSVLEDFDKYNKFEKKTKLIYEYEVVAKESPKDDRTVASKNQQVSAVSSDSLAKNPFIVYISGSDTRKVSLQTSRSDVNILAVVNPNSKMVLLLNTPRDYYIPTTKSASGELDKLTHCGMYGIDCSMATLSQLYDEEIKYYAQINFKGFSALVDAFGGVTVENNKSFTSDDDFFYPQGTVTMDGEHALSFVRERHSFADGDNQRGRNQMKVIKALIGKAKDSETLLTHYTDILASIEGMFMTNVSTSDMSDLVKMQLNDLSGWTVVSYAVNGNGAKRKTFTMPTRFAYVTIPDMATVEKAKELIDMVYDGKILTEEDLEMSTGTEGTSGVSGESTGTGSTGTGSTGTENTTTLQQ